MFNIGKIYILKTIFVMLSAALLFSQFLKNITYPPLLFPFIIVLHLLEVVNLKIVHFGYMLFIYFLVLIVVFIFYMAVWRIKPYYNYECSKFIDNALRNKTKIPFCFILYIRPFDADISHTMVLPGLNEHKISASYIYTKKVFWTTGKHLSKGVIERTILRFMPLVALAPAGYIGEESSCMISADDIVWMEYIEKLIIQSTIIICIPIVDADISNKEEHFESYNKDINLPQFSTVAKSGTLFEIELLIKRQYLNKTIFVIPPSIDLNNWKTSTSCLSKLGLGFPPAQADYFSRVMLKIDYRKYPSLRKNKKNSLLFKDIISISYNNDMSIRDIASSDQYIDLPLPNIDFKISNIDRFLSKNLRYLV